MKRENCENCRYASATSGNKDNDATDLREWLAMSRWFRESAPRGAPNRTLARALYSADQRLSRNFLGNSFDLLRNTVLARIHAKCQS